MIDPMPDFDLSTPSGKQAFQQWFVNVVRNEVNSYARQVLATSKDSGNIKRVIVK